MGDQGTLLSSESELNYAGKLHRDANAPAWDTWIKNGCMTARMLQQAAIEAQRGRSVEVLCPRPDLRERSARETRHP